MAVKINIFGEVAIVNNLEWTCKDIHIEDTLNSMTNKDISPSQTDPDKDAAKDVIKVFPSAKIIHADPPEEYDPNTIY